VSQEIQGCVSRDSVLCFRSFRVVSQEIQGCVSRDSVLCFKRFSVAFQEIQGYVSRVSGVCSKSFNVVYLFLWFWICPDWLQKRIFVCQKMLTESNDNSGPLSYGSWTHLLAGGLSNLCSKCQMENFLEKFATTCIFIIRLCKQINSGN